jgi:hypothetical protein
MELFVFKRLLIGNFDQCVATDEKAQALCQNGKTFSAQFQDIRRIPRAELLEADALRSRIEKDFACRVWREENHQYVLKPGRCAGDTARTWAHIFEDLGLKDLPAGTRYN